MNQDPIGFGGGINVYSYAGNNPVNGIDPGGFVIVRIISYLVAGLNGNGGWHRGILVIDNVGGRGAYSFAGGPEVYGFLVDNGNLISRSGHWAPGTQDYGMYRGCDDTTRRTITVLDNDRPSYQAWVDKFKSIEAEIATHRKKVYSPLPLDYSPFFSEANSNTWAHHLISRAGLEGLYDHAISKLDGGDLPYAPGWDIDLPYNAK